MWAGATGRAGEGRGTLLEGGPPAWYGRLIGASGRGFGGGEVRLKDADYLHRLLPKRYLRT